MPPRQHRATEFNPNGLPMRIAASYSRDIAASLARAWENVRDWEHLPWLHADSFSACRLDDEGDWGWRAVTRGTGAAANQETVIELAIDAGNLRYVSRTLEGPLPGVEIWTRFTELEPRKTRVDVEFHLPHLAQEQAAKAGKGLIRLYTKLWDEDEAMMIARQQALDRRGQVARDPVPLGPLDALRRTLPLTLDIDGMTLRIIGLRGTLHAYPARCPHMMAPLDQVVPDADGCITCPWHGYRFDVATGLSSDGRGLSLGAMPRIDIDEENHATLIWP
ncbi:MAG: Rieske 2Fe-2S domain-containing protein [Parvibaculum sp.]|uniref:Rieske 2Fe-2S domain-containing protein n=1 Tax=Parvibaculum sp. TaxID=2024848 RepID=UPI003C7162C0